MPGISGQNPRIYGWNCISILLVFRATALLWWYRTTPFSLSQKEQLWGPWILFFIQNSVFFLFRNKLNKTCFTHRQFFHPRKIFIACLILRDNHGPGNPVGGIMTYSLYTKRYSLSFLFNKPSVSHVLNRVSQEWSGRDSSVSNTFSSSVNT